MCNQRINNERSGDSTRETYNQINNWPDSSRFKFASINVFSDNRDFKQPTTTPPNSTTGSKNVLFASNAHANDFSGVDVQLWTTGDA